jgi:hypothetical protein
MENSLFTTHRQGIWAIIGVIIGIIAYVPYLRDMLAGRTKPHIFSRFIWWVLTWIAFRGQWMGSGGAGIRVLGTGSLMCLFTTVFSLFHGGERYITRSDRRALAGAGIAMLVRRVSNTPLWSMLLVTIIDMLGFRPTLRKWRQDPRTETPSSYFMNGIKYIFGLAALAWRSPITVMYPASLVILNSGFAIVLWWRRGTLRKKNT